MNTHLKHSRSSLASAPVVLVAEESSSRNLPGVQKALDGDQRLRARRFQRNHAVRTRGRTVCLRGSGQPVRHAGFDTRRPLKREEV